MRLWAQQLIPHLPKQRTLGMHRELCGIRGVGWRNDHETIDYVFDYSIERLIGFHLYFLNITSVNHGINYTKEWLDPKYRGKQIGFDESVLSEGALRFTGMAVKDNCILYPEHDKEFVERDIKDLQERSEDFSIQSIDGLENTIDGS